MVSLMLGAVSTSAPEVLALLFNKLRGVPPSDVQAHAVVFNIRLPRLLTALLVGAALGASGATMQGLFRNPLADPSLLGVSLGASLGAACVLVLANVTSSSLTPLAAFCGGLLATVVATRAARRGNGMDTASLLLAGIAVQAFCGAMIGFLTYVASDARQRDLTFWLLGSLGGATWSRLALSAVPLALAVLSLPWLGGALDALSLGEAEAGDLGVDVRRVRRLGIALTALGVGAAVAVTGPVGFVGLAVPHLVRILGVHHYRALIAASAAFGALLLVVADLLARTVAKPAEIPIGVVTAFLGAPFFYALLLKRGRP